MTDIERKMVGGRLRDIRETLGKSQNELARDFGCTGAFISMIERGLSAPSVGILAALERMGFSPSWLLTGLGSINLDSADPPASSDFLAHDAAPSSPRSSILLTSSPDHPLAAGDVILVRIDHVSGSVKHPLVGKILHIVSRRK